MATVLVEFHRTMYTKHGIMQAKQRIHCDEAEGEQLQATGNAFVLRNVDPDPKPKRGPAQ